MKSIPGLLIIYILPNLGARVENRGYIESGHVMLVLSIIDGPVNVMGNFSGVLWSGAFVQIAADLTMSLKTNFPGLQIIPGHLI